MYMRPTCISLQSTFIFQMKASVAHRAIAAKRQVHEVGCALNLLWKFTVLKTADQMNTAVEAIVDIQEIIVGLNTETTESQKRNK